MVYWGFVLVDCSFHDLLHINQVCSYCFRNYTGHFVTVLAGLIDDLDSCNFHTVVSHSVIVLAIVTTTDDHWFRCILSWAARG